MNCTPARIAALAIAGALSLTACAPGTDQPASDAASATVDVASTPGASATGATEPVVTGEPAESVVPVAPTSCPTPPEDAVPESELNAALDALLTDHIDRTHDLVEAAGATGLDSAETAAANERLDANGVDLGDAVAGIYGEGAGDAFVALWRTHLQLFVDYAVGIATDDADAVAEADAGLRQYSHDFGAFFESATGGHLPADMTADEFDGHVDTVQTLIRDTLAGGETQESHHDARAHVVRLSSAMSEAISAQLPCRFPA